jgi:Holliday junction resolvasome RuvABC endonuclease subunit
MTEALLNTTSILALDLSRTTGWAFGHQFANAPRFGRIFIDKISFEGGRFLAFRENIAELFEELQPDRVVMEAPQPMERWHTTMDTMMQQLGLRAFVVAEAAKHNAALTSVSCNIVRGDILGQSRFAKNTVKQTVTRFCWERGWRVRDDNEGDAALMWLWAIQAWRGNRRRSGPLFVETAA